MSALVRAFFSKHSVQLAPFSSALVNLISCLKFNPNCTNSWAKSLNFLSIFTFTPHQASSPAHRLQCYSLLWPHWHLPTFRLRSPLQLHRNVKTLPSITSGDLSASSTRRNSLTLLLYVFQLSDYLPRPTYSTTIVHDQTPCEWKSCSYFPRERTDSRDQPQRLCIRWQVIDTSFHHYIAHNSSLQTLFTSTPI